MKSILGRAAFLLFAGALMLVGLAMAFLQSWRLDRIADLDSVSQVAETKSGPVEYLVHGDGPAVLVFHGGAGGHDQAMLFALSEQMDSFQLIAPSRPGYLRTPLSTGKTPEEQADAMAALLDTLGIQSVAAIGVSAGGPFAVQFAIRHPDKVWSLVLLSAVTEPSNIFEGDGELRRFLGNSTLADAGSWLLNRTAEHDFPEFLDRTLKFEDTLDPARRAALASHVEAHSDQVDFLQALCTTIAPLSVRASGLLNDEAQIRAMQPIPFEKISAPTLLVHGTADRRVSVDESKVAASRIPNAQLLLVENAGHFVQIGTDVDKTRAAIADFLRRHSGGHSQP